MDKGMFTIIPACSWCDWTLHECDESCIVGELAKTHIMVGDARSMCQYLGVRSMNK